jgi:hypothetical protein
MQRLPKAARTVNAKMAPTLITIMVVAPERRAYAVDNPELDVQISHIDVPILDARFSR